MVPFRVGAGALSCLSLWVLFPCLAMAQEPSRSRDAAAAPPPVVTDQATVHAKRERATVHRFLQLLKRRPRFGTALDRVYGYHVGRGTLDEFTERLETEATAKSDGKLYMVLGMVAMQRGQDAVAAEYLETAEKLLPEEPLASYYLGKTLVLLGQVDEAGAAMRRSVQRKPARADMLAIFKDLGAIYQRTGQQEQALQVWNELEAMFPGDVQVQEEIASILAEEGAYQSAHDRYAKLAASVRDRFRRVEMGIRAAQLKARMGQSQEALAAFEEQLAVVNPDSWLHRDIRRRIEEVFWSSNDVDGLVEYYTQWTQSHPEDVDAMMRTARVLSVQQRLPEAKQWFRKAIEKAPSDPAPRLALVDALVAASELDQAATEMERLVELQPDNPDYLVRWGELALNNRRQPEDRRRKKAVDVWLRLLNKRGDDPVNVGRVADLLRSAGAVDRAIEHYRKAIELAPADPQYREYLGEYFHQLDRKDDALETWRGIAEGQRATRDNLVRLSEVYSTFGYAERALEAIAAACQQQPLFAHRARYAELLREAKQYDNALRQLNLAEQLAEDPELREIVIEQRIKIYQARGTLAQRIEECETRVSGDDKTDPDAWRLLALLRDADRKFQPACSAIDQACVLAPSRVAVWDTAAKLHERAGNFGQAVQAYRHLATLDRRFLSNYLTQIASIEMRIGNVQAAMKAGEELIASARGNSEHFRFFADMCFQLGNVERGLDVLRKNVRSNPNDEEAIMRLAGKLATEFRTAEAVELYWQAFDLAKSVDDRIPIIQQLTELYLRTNRFDTLVERLETTAREQNRPRDAVLWSATAHQAAGDLGRAKTLLEQLVREDSRDTRLIEQLVKLAREEYDFETAADYQRRLVAIAPTPENEHQFANILLEVGDIDEAQSLWMKLSQRNDKANSIVDSLNTLIQEEQFETAAVLADRALNRQPDNWEVLGRALIIHVRLGDFQTAEQLADRVLQMDVDPGEPTEKIRRRRQRQRSRGQPASSLSRQYRQLDSRLPLVSSIGRIKQSYLPGTQRYGYPGRTRVYTPTSFLGVQVLAQCVPLAAAESQDAGALTEIVGQRVATALKTQRIDDLWTAIFALAWDNERLSYGQESDPSLDKCLEALVELNDVDGASFKLRMLVSQWQRNRNSPAPSISDEQLEQAERLVRITKRSSEPMISSYYSIWVARLLYLQEETERADALMDDFLNIALSSGGSNQFNFLLQSINLLVGNRFTVNSATNEAMVEKAVELFNAVLDQHRFSNAAPSGNYMSQPLGTLVQHFAMHDQISQAVDVMDQILAWQADQTSQLRPSQRDRIHTGKPLQARFYTNGRSVTDNVTFPPASGYFGSESILALRQLFHVVKDDADKLKQTTDLLAELAEQPTGDRFVRRTRTLAKATFAYWSGDLKTAEETLASANTAEIRPQFVQLTRARLLYDSGRIRESLALVEKLRPTNQQMLVDRELTILQLVLQLGDLERAKSSARKLFALRLPSEVEFRLADLMYQLGMREMGDRMMGRIRRRAGGQHETLVQLMTRYAAAGDMQRASEIARQIVRRTDPQTNTSYRTVQNQQHAQALQILVQANQLEPLIQRYEKRFKRSPNSSKVLAKLASFYEAAGRRADARNLRLESTDGGAISAKGLFDDALNLANASKSDEAIERFLEAIEKSPDLLERRYYELRNTFRTANAYDQLAERIIEIGIRQFRQSYRLSEIASELIRADQHVIVDRLIAVGLRELKPQDSSYNYLLRFLSNAQYTPGEQVRTLIKQFLTSKDSRLNGLEQSGFVYSRSTNGRTNGTVNGFARIVLSDDQYYQDVRKALETHVEESPEWRFPRVLLCLMHAHRDSFDEIESLLKPILAKEPKDSIDTNAIWCVASTLSHSANQHELAYRLLESIGEDANSNRGLAFRYSLRSLQAYAYRKAGRGKMARDVLLHAARTQQVDDRYSSGHGEYQYLNSMFGIVGELLESGYPAEALITFQKAITDEELLARASNHDYIRRQQEQLAKQIEGKLTSDLMRRIVEQALRNTIDGDAESEAAVDADSLALLLKPSIKTDSLIDTHVALTLEHIVERVKDDESVQTSLKEFMVRHPLGEIATLDASTARQLAVRLVIANAVEDASQVAGIANALDQAFTAPLEAGDATAPDDGKSESAGQPVGEEGEATELYLALIAHLLTETDVEDDLIVRLTKRAARLARQSQRMALAESLECQLAQRIAKTDPKRARDILMRALDRVMPLNEKGGGRGEESDS